MAIENHPFVKKRIKGLLGAFVQHRNAANLLMLLLLMFGYWGATHLQRQLLPSLEIRVVTVSTAWTGASAQDIEKNILQVIEPAVRFLEGVTEMSSSAREGSGSIQLSFAANTNMQTAEDEVQAAVDSVQNLPTSAEAPDVSQIKFFDPVASIGISGPFPEQSLRQFAREIRDGLLDVGLDKVYLNGYREREIVITVDDAKLRQYDLTLDDLSRALQPGLFDRPSGALDGAFQAQIRAVAKELSATQIATTVVKSLPSGEDLVFGDIASIEDRFDEDISLGFMRGEPAIQLSVARAASSDTVASYNKIQTYVEEIRPTLPQSLSIQIFDAPAELVNDRLNLLVKNGLSGMVLVLVILFIFLEMRIAIWVAVGIPVSILATLGVMYFTGQSLNMISMFALLMTLGIIVDDAIVVGEHTATRYAMGDSRQQAAVTGAGRMAIPVIAASLTTIAAFAPILIVGDVIGQILGALPMVVIAVLIASGIECFLILPGHLSHSLPKKRKAPGWFRRNFDHGFDYFRDNIFGKLSALSYRWRYATVALAIAITVIGGALLASGALKFEFFPTAEGEEFNIYATFQPGTPNEQMHAIFVDIEKVITEAEAELAPEGEQLVVTTYAELDSANNRASIDVYLTSSETRTVRTAAITQTIRDGLPNIAGVESIGVREQGSGPGGRAIEIEFSGANTTILKQASERLQSILGGFPGVTAISDTLRYGDPELTMELTSRGTALGFTLDMLGVQIRDAFEGRIVETLATSEEEITVRLVHNLPNVGSSALRELWVRSTQGAFVPLSSIVTFDEQRSFSRIVREEGKSTVTVLADVEDEEGDVTGADVLKRLQSDYLPAITSEYGVVFKLGGTEKETNDAIADLRLGALVALGVMYIIIAWTFASYAAPLAVMLIIPFGLVGAIWGHYWLGHSLTIMSLMGLLGLAGILVNDSIVLISRLKERQEMGESLRQASNGAARDRLRAVLLTSLTTIGGLIPLLFEKSLQAQFLIPMAVTMIFGLGLATLLVLFLVPAFLAIGADIGALVRYIFMTPNASTFRELLEGYHHEKRPEISVEESSVEGLDVAKFDLKRLGAQPAE